MDGVDWNELNLRYIRIDVLVEKENTKIYRVKDTVTNDICVMKIRKARDLTGIYRQLEEIHHPNLPEIYEVVYDGCDTIIVEEYIPGEGLDLRINREVLTEKETVDIALQLCDALTTIHTQKPRIIHRDIKASNVMVKADGVVKLIDFDVARNYHEEQERDTQQMGTVEYASPEHFGYAQTDEKSDIYSVGILMHEMLTGETFSQENIRYKGKLKHIIYKCSRVKANRRYRTALQVKRKLNGHQYYRKRRVIMVLLLMSAFVLSTGVTMYYYRQKKLQQVAEGEKKKSKEELEKEDFFKRIATFDKENGNVADFLENEYIMNQISYLLQNDTTYFLNNFDKIRGAYDETEKAYIITGNRVEPFTSRFERYCSAIIIRENGNIQCAYTNEQSYLKWLSFATNAEEEYHKVPISIIGWYISLYQEDFLPPLDSVLESYEQEEVSLILPGDYTLRSLEGRTGRIHISEHSKKGSKSKSYKIEGMLTYEDMERKIDISVKGEPPYYIYEKDEMIIAMIPFFDSVFLWETYYSDDDVEEEEVTVSVDGQYIKENEDS